MIQQEPRSLEVHFEYFFYRTSLVMPQQLQGNGQGRGGAFGQALEYTLAEITEQAALAQVFQKIRDRILPGQGGPDPIVHFRLGAEYPLR